MTRMEGDATEWIYGIIPVMEALRAGRRRVLGVWMVPPGRNARLAGLREMAGGVTIHEVTHRELDRRCQGGRHQGVMARVGPFPWSSLGVIVREQGPLLLLEGVQDPHNLGAIIRSAVAMGVVGVVLEKRRTAPITPVVAKSASGALEHVRLCQVSNLPRAIRDIKREGRWVVGTTDRDGTPLWEANWPESVALVVGSEGTGLRPIVSSSCDLWVTIPALGPIGTLNASVATAVVLYEVMRREEKR